MYICEMKVMFEHFISNLPRKQTSRPQSIIGNTVDTSFMLPA